MLEHLQDLQEASYLLTEAAADLFEQERNITSKLKYTKRAIMASIEGIAEEDAQSLRSAMLNPETAEYFKEVAFSPHDNSHKTAVAQSTTEQMNGALSFVGSMGLVFAHSFFEDFLMNCFKIITCQEPNAWVQKIGKKTVALEELAAVSFAELASQKLASHLTELKEKSLIKKISEFESMVRLSHAPSEVRGFIYDVEEIRRLDDLRHAFAHRRLTSYDVSEAEKDIEYLFRTAFHFLTLLLRKYDLKGAYRPK